VQPMPDRQRVGGIGHSGLLGGSVAQRGRGLGSHPNELS
jgi:hypothetical protein